MRIKSLVATILMIGVIASCGNAKSVEGNKVVKTPDAYYLYYNKSVIKLTPDTYITKDKKVSDYFRGNIFSNGEDNFLSDLRKYFPLGFNGLEEGAAPSEFVEIPLLSLGDNKNIINSIQLSEDLASKNPELLITQDETKEEEKVIEEKDASVSLKDKNIVILNANGINGSAKTLGEKLKADLGVEYTAENYGKSETFNMIVNRKLTTKELNELIDRSGFKYIKILQNDSLKPEADVILINGNDSNVTFNVEVISKSGDDSIAKSLEGYKAKTKKDTQYNNKDISDDITIYYNPNDILTASKIGRMLNTDNLVENLDLTNKITITVK